ILLYLVQTVGRQIIEQQQFPRTSTAALLQQHARKSREQLSSSGAKKLQHQNSSSGSTSNNNNNNNSNSANQMDTDSNNAIPDHHLEPPQFYPTIINPKESSPILSTCQPIMSPYDNEHLFSLDQQQQTSQLDRFTYFLLAKCNTV
ncbi:unnamed protein product, partial [Rotaria magnacalcarata]